MTKERTVEVGGEILRVGDRVVVYTGRERQDREIAKIGTKLIYLIQYGREEPFDIATRRRTAASGYVPQFRTRTEAAAMDRRRDLLLQLRGLGLQPVEGPLSDLTGYPDRALEEVIGVLAEYSTSGADNGVDPSTSAS